MPRAGAGVWLPLQLLLVLCHSVIASPAAQGGSAQQVIRQPLPDHVLQPTQRKLHGRFLHITDFHPDPFYKTHSSTEDGIACHRGRGLAGSYGAETTDCDSPFSLVNATFDWIESNIKDDIDFVVWTGDSARHDGDEKHPRNAAEVLSTNRMLANKFVDTFGSSQEQLSIPVVPTFGNNDFLPHNIMYAGPNKWFTAYSDIWANFIPEEQRHSFAYGGWFYVEVIPRQLAVFSLNTMYFFDRNAGVNGCADPSEPGYQHLEWLRVQLQLIRERGMKAILMGHVPPARTENKKNWDETCWQRYTLWLQQYRDIIVGGLYGHMNIDHFLLHDTKDIDLNIDLNTASAKLRKRERIDQELSVTSRQDYLEALRDQWSDLPGSAGRVLDEDDVITDKKGKKHKKKKSKKGKLGKIGGKYAERYHVSLVSPSVVPNYFPTLRVFEYNITGLGDVSVWEASPGGVDNVISETVSKDPTDPQPHEDGDEVHLELKRDVDTETKKKKGKNDKKGKGRKKKGKGKKPHKDPDLIIPEDPPEGSLPGPAHLSQAFTLLGYTQYYANLTYINNDFHGADVEESKWRNGDRDQKEPKYSKPRPRKFNYEVEYSTFDDEIYKLSDLTVRNYLKLAYRIGSQKSKSSGKNVDTFDEVLDDDDIDDDNEEPLDEDVDEESEVDTEGKKGKKDRTKNAKDKAWLHFLNHAFVSTISEKDLKHDYKILG